MKSLRKLLTGKTGKSEILHAREREFELYLALQKQLSLSRVAFKRFVMESMGKVSLGTYLRGGACMLPGWVNYLQEYAFPLNKKAEEIIAQIAELGELPRLLQDFLRYQKAFEAKYEAWKKGGVLDCDLHAGFNFPATLDEYIDRHLAALSTEPGVRHLVLQ